MYRIGKYLRAVVLCGCAAILGGGCAGAGGGATASPGPEVQAEEEKTPPIDVLWEPGRPWSEAQSYLSQLRFRGGRAADALTVQFCDECNKAHLVIYPEERARNLRHPKDFDDASRVIAAVVMYDDEKMSEIWPTETHELEVAYLVTVGSDSARFMYESTDGKIEYSRKWPFGENDEEDDEHRAHAGRLKAVWFPLPHHLHRRSPQVVHISSAWIACAEGCCYVGEPPSK
jgi:hypothetical protein